MMITSQSVAVAIGLIVVVAGIVYLRFRKTTLAGDYARAVVMSYNPADRDFESVAYKKSLIALPAGAFMLFADAIAGFPHLLTAQGLVARMIYFTMLFGGAYNIAYGRKRK